MKTSLFIIPFLALLNLDNLKSQDTYTPFSTVTDWKVDAGAFGSSWEYWYNYIGDTLINNFTYRIIEFEAFEDYFVKLYFRENVFTRKVYLYDFEEDADILYYDFGLEVGEEFFVDYTSVYFTVYKIDTVMGVYGPLKRWYLERNSLYFRYTEAVGGDRLDYQYWIYVADPTHYTSCAYNYCDKIFGQDDCSPPPFRQITTNQEISICEGDEYMGYTSSGVYYDTLSSQADCDSIVITTLNVLPPIFATIDTTICEGESYYGYTEEGIYEVTLSGTTGCDTILTLEIVVLPPDHPECLTATDEYNFIKLEIFPNPVKEEVNIRSNENIQVLQIKDIHGELVFEQKDFDTEIPVDVTHLPSGIYLILGLGKNMKTLSKFLKI